MKWKKKYNNTFKDDWLQINEYIDKLKKNDIHTAECKKYSVKFTVKHSGEKAV